MLEFYGRKFTCDECPICEGIEHRVRVPIAPGKMRQECDTQFVSHSVHPIRCANSIGVGAHRYLPDFSTAPFAGQ